MFDETELEDALRQILECGATAEQALVILAAELEEEDQADEYNWPAAWSD